MTVAASQFPLSTVKILLDHGVSTRGTMAMHAAAFQAANDPTRYEVLNLLLLYDGDVNEMEVDPKGRNRPRLRTPFTGTPLHHAIKAGSVEPVKYLLEKGADSMAPSWAGMNALRAAECDGNVKVVEMVRSWCQPPPDYESLCYQKKG